MRKILCLLFTGLYALGVLYFFSAVLVLLNVRIPDRAWLFIGAAWLALCFTGYRWRTPFLLATYRLRKTIQEEEEWLHPLMHDLNIRTGISPVPQLLILEDSRLEAYATGINRIVISRGLLVRLSEQEIKAVLAHEYGHLRDRDMIRYAGDMRLSLSNLSKLAGMNECTLKRGFRMLFGTTPYAYYTTIKMQQAKSLLLDTKDGVADIAYRLGYSQASSFGHEFRKAFGVSPGEFRRKGGKV